MTGRDVINTVGPGMPSLPLSRSRRCSDWHHPYLSQSGAQLHTTDLLRLTASLAFIWLSLALVYLLLCLRESTAQKKEALPVHNGNDRDKRTQQKKVVHLKGGIHPFSEVPCFSSSCSKSCANQDDRKKRHNVEYLDFCPGSEVGSYFIPFGGGG